jgi:hypothetical protein
VVDEADIGENEEIGIGEVEDMGVEQALSACKAFCSDLLERSHRVYRRQGQGKNSRSDVTRGGASLSRSSNLDWGGELRHGDPLRSVLYLSLFRCRVVERWVLAVVVDGVMMVR